jgi:hypothetical protein
MGVYWVFKSKSILPLYTPSQNQQYDGQTETPDSFRLLLIELYRGKFLKNIEHGIHES